MKYNRLKKICLASLLIMGISPSVMAYQVWLNTNKSYQGVALETNKWDITGNAVDGVLLVTGSKAAVGDPINNRPTTSQWQTIVSNFSTNRIMTPVTATNIYVIDNGDAGETVRKAAQDVAGFGTQVTHIFMYNSLTHVLNSGDYSEARAWLDGDGRTNVKLLWNVRNNHFDDRDNYIDSPLVDELVFEAEHEKWNTGNVPPYVVGNPYTVGNRHLALEYSFKNTGGKYIYFLVPNSATPVVPGDAPYSDMRRMLIWMKDEIVPGIGINGNNFMRSARIRFIPAGYGPSWDFYPDVVGAGSQWYGNSLFGTTLSLIEHKDFFEGRYTAPNENQRINSTLRRLEL